MKISGRSLLARQRVFFTCFSVGVLIGIVIINIGKGVLLGDMGLFNEETLSQMMYMTVDGNAFFCYILRKRIGRLLILAVLSTTYLGLASCMGISFWYGMSAGTLLASLIIRYGLKGILLAVVSIFPQYLLYVPAVLAMLYWCEELYKGIYVRGEFNTGEKKVWIGKAGQLLAILAAVGAGCLLEGYLNPYLLLGFLKIF
ncbi:MAG: hypothetical protein HFH91_03955 [Lachnospiraceae bacterium]|nr:hypothetical protein [Lachnospiraceae bacterium]